MSACMKELDDYQLLGPDGVPLPKEPYTQPQYTPHKEALGFDEL